MLAKILIGVAGVLLLFGSPLEKRDPNMQKTFEGPAAGVGQSYAWNGKEAGKGKMTIEESVPGQKVGMKLEFVEPMKSTATCALTLAGTPTGSFVTWSMAGNHNVIGKAFGMFMDMDNMLGTDIEKGLAQLKAVAEAKQAAIAAAAAAQAELPAAALPAAVPDDWLAPEGSAVDQAARLTLTFASSPTASKRRSTRSIVTF